MDEADWLAARFEEQRAHLRAVAYRMLGSQAEADDAVQNSWLRLSGADTSAVENLAGWLTTVVAREADRGLGVHCRRRHDHRDRHDLRPRPAPARRPGRPRPVRLSPGPRSSSPTPACRG